MGNRCVGSDLQTLCKYQRDDIYINLALRFIYIYIYLYTTHNTPICIYQKDRGFPIPSKLMSIFYKILNKSKFEILINVHIERKNNLRKF